MAHDRLGLVLSTGSAQAAEAFRTATDLLLSAWPGAPEGFAAAIVADPDFALAHISQARVLQMQGRMAEAQTAAATAQAAVAGATPREVAHVAILARLIHGDAPGAITAAEAHLEVNPRDTLILAALLGAFGLYALSGRADHDAARVAICRRVAPHYADDWWFAGYLGWSLTEAGAREEGLHHTRRALALRPHNANAAHALAHAHFDRGEVAQGREFLAGFLPSYPVEAALNGHLSWHQALFALEQNDLPTALGLYEARLRPAVSTAPALNTMTDAVSLLWRLHLRATPASPGWDDVAAHAEARFPAPGLAFADVHMAMVEAMSGRHDELAQRIAGLDRLLAAGRLAAGPVVPGLCRGIAAFAAARYDEAADLLLPLLPEVVRIGGSGAQRDIVVDTVIAACLRAARMAEAQQVLRRRLAH